MTDRSVKVRLSAEVDGFIANVRRAQAATEDFAHRGQVSMTKHKAEWDGVGKAVALAGAGIGVAVLGAVKAFADFDQSMSGVAAVTGATKKEMHDLSEAAIIAGQKTVFSASEAAKAEAELAKAGVSVKDILSGGLIGSMNLAAAGQIDLAKSAEISAQAMNIFKLAGSDVGHIADVLTAGANKSAAGVDDLGMALQQGGLVAAQTGLSLEDTVGVLSAFADNALKSSDAGTSLKTMLQRLTPQSQEAATLMNQLGLHFYNAQGNFVGIARVAEQLQKSLGGLTQEQRNSALATLFGSDAVRGANILYQEGAAGIQEYVKAVNDQGAAARMAARQTDNLKGDIEQLKGSLESAFIRGGSGGNAGVRSLVQDLTGVVNKFNSLPPAVQSDVVAFAAFSAGALLVTGGAIKMTTSILSMKTSMDAAGISSARLAVLLKGLGAAVAVVGVAAVATELQRMQGEASVASVKVDKLANSLTQLSAGGRLTGGVADLFRQDNGIRADEKFVSAAEAIERFGKAANTSLPSGFWADFKRGFNQSGDAVAAFDKQVRQIDAALAEMVRNGHADDAKKALDSLLKGVDPSLIGAARGKFTEYGAALDEAKVAAAGAATSQTGLSENLQTVQQNAEDAKKAVDDYLKSLQDAGLAVLSTRDAQRQFKQSVEDAKKAVHDNGKTLNINTKEGRDNAAALDAVARNALDLADAIYQQTGSEEAYRKSLQASRKSLIDTGIRMGLTKAAAERYADAILKIPSKSATTFATPGLTTARKAVETMIAKVRQLDGKVVTTTVRVVNVTAGSGAGSSLSGGITRADGGFVEAYAGGGLREPMIARGGANILWAEPETGWEAYISGKPSMRSKNIGVLAEATRRLGITPAELLSARRYAGGGFAGASGAPSSVSTTNDNRITIERVEGLTVAQIESEAVERRRQRALRSHG